MNSYSRTAYTLLRKRKTKHPAPHPAPPISQPHSRQSSSPLPAPHSPLPAPRPMLPAPRFFHISPTMPPRASKHRRPPVVLTIAGSDPSGGAGQEADLKTFLRHGVYGMNLTTLLTVQNTRGVQSVKPLDPDFLERQWTALLEDIRPNVIKIGALGSVAMMRRVAKLLNSSEARGIPVVLDPVLGSTSGSPLLDAKALAGFRRELRPRCRVVTPNFPEFEALFGPFAAGMPPEERLRSLGRRPYAVLLKGGHVPGARTAGCPDWLWDRGRLVVLPGKR